MALRRVGKFVGIAFGGTAVVAGGSATVYAYVEPVGAFLTKTFLCSFSSHTLTLLSYMPRTSWESYMQRVCVH